MEQNNASTDELVDKFTNGYAVIVGEVGDVSQDTFGQFVRQAKTAESELNRRGISTDVLKKFYKVKVECNNPELSQ